jgi:ATP-dependent Clp protease ATP-binding subunit ClpC
MTEGEPMNGYNFTERVRKVLTMAREEAVRLHHEYVGTEHILLGLIREGEGVAATVLQNLNVELDEIQQKIEETVKKGKAAQTPGPDLPYTSRAKKVLELAMTEARDLQHSYVGTEHLLLSLIAERKGVAAQVLVQAGVTVDIARAETLRILGTELPREMPWPPYEALGAVRGRSIERVEVILHYHEGHRHQSSFTSAQAAAGFLMWAAPRRP